MAADLAHTPNTGIRVQSCGDAHLMNFGAFATPERRVIFDIYARQNESDYKALVRAARQGRIEVYTES
jgi:uncharacterized protein (DUF2252 family)